VEKINNKSKAIIIIQDGLGDRPIDVLGGKTPLETAKTPTINRLAKEGITGIMDPVKPGIRVGTDVGHLALFGLDPIKDYYGRGPIEAAGLGIELKENDIAFRANFATVNEEFVVKDRRAGRIKSTNQLAKELENIKIKDCKINIYPATEHRAVLVISGEGLSGDVTPSDPLEGNEDDRVKKIKSINNTQKEIKTAEILNIYTKKVYKILNQHPLNIKRKKRKLLPANMILIRSGGKIKKSKKTVDKFKIKAACVAAEETVKGVARQAGFSVHSLEGMTGGKDTNMMLNVKLCKKVIKNNRMVFIHIKGTDLCGHDNEPNKKIEIIEKVDKMIGEILKFIDRNTYVALTADHSTPCVCQIHTGDPVPVLIWGPQVRIDKVVNYDEISCMKGGLNRITGEDFFNIIADLLCINQKYGS